LSPVAEDRSDQRRRHLVRHDHKQAGEITVRGMSSQAERMPLPADVDEVLVPELL
jgi:hypothetical protein